MSKNYNDDDYVDDSIDTAESEPHKVNQQPVLQEPQPPQLEPQQPNQPPVIQEPRPPQVGTQPNEIVSPRGRGRGRGRPPGGKQPPKLVVPTSPQELNVMPHLSPEVRRSTRVATKNKQ